MATTSKKPVNFLFELNKKLNALYMKALKTKCGSKVHNSIMDQIKALENLKKQRAQRENIKERGKITTEEVMKSYSKDHNGGHPYDYNGGKTR